MLGYKHNSFNRGSVAKNGKKGPPVPEGSAQLCKTHVFT